MTYDPVTELAHVLYALTGGGMVLYIVAETYQQDRGNGNVVDVTVFTACDTEREARDYAADCEDDPDTIGVELRTVEWNSCKKVPL